VPLDRIDRALLTELERDARQSFAQLGETVGLSKTPAWKRVQALEAAGVIEGYRALVNPQAVGLEIHAFVQVEVAFERHDAFEAAVRRHPAVLACYATAGDADYVLEVRARTMSDLDQLLRQELCMLPGIKRFSTTIGMKTIKAHGSVMGVTAG